MTSSHRRSSLNGTSERWTTVSPDTTAEEASKIMQKKQVRRLPVVENGRLVGILAIGQLARHESLNAAGETLKDVSQPAAKR